MEAGGGGAEGGARPPQSPPEVGADGLRLSLDAEIPPNDVPLRFSEARIGLVLTGVDSEGMEPEDPDEPCAFVEVVDVAHDSPASRHAGLVRIHALPFPTLLSPESPNARGSPAVHSSLTFRAWGSGTATRSSRSRASRSSG